MSSPNPFRRAMSLDSPAVGKGEDRRFVINVDEERRREAEERRRQEELEERKREEVNKRDEDKNERSEGPIPGKARRPIQLGTLLD
jgi:hypothetical protein